MEAKQIDLSARPLPQKKLFLREMFAHYEHNMMFNMLNSDRSLARAQDEAMSIDVFVRNLQQDSPIRLLLGSPSPKTITGGARGVYVPSTPGIERYLMWEIPLTQQSYDTITRLVKPYGVQLK